MISDQNTFYLAFKDWKEESFRHYIKIIFAQKNFNDILATFSYL